MSDYSKLERSNILDTGTMWIPVAEGHLCVKSSYFGVIIGGVIMGIGFAVAGYCPGTGLTALADGRKHALFFKRPYYQGDRLMDLWKECLGVKSHQKRLNTIVNENVSSEHQSFLWV